MIYGNTLVFFVGSQTDRHYTDVFKINDSSAFTS